jgi:hypothetical protein
MYWHRRLKQAFCVVDRYRLIIKFHKQSPSWESDSSSTGQTIPTFLLWNQKNSVHLKCTLILSYHIRLDFSSALFPSYFRTKFLYSFLIFSCVLYDPSTLILLDLIDLIIFCEECNCVVSYMNCPPVTAYFLSCIHTFSSAPSLQIPPNATDHLPQPYKTTGKIMVLCVLLLRTRALIAQSV